MPAISCAEGSPTLGSCAHPAASSQQSAARTRMRPGQRRRRLTRKPASAAMPTDFSGLADTKLQVSASSFFCVAFRLSPCTPSHLAAGAAAPAALSTASCAMPAARSIAGLTAPAIELTAAWALVEALLRALSPKFGMPAALDELTRSVVSIDGSSSIGELLVEKDVDDDQDDDWHAQDPSKKVFAHARCSSWFAAACPQSVRS